MSILAKNNYLGDSSVSRSYQFWHNGSHKNKATTCPYLTLYVCYQTLERFECIHLENIS